MGEFRLGDDVDDYCVRCKRVTNHAIVSLDGPEPAKVRCRTCYSDHDYRKCEIPLTKKEAAKKELFDAVLRTSPGAANGEPEKKANTRKK
jgi:hypothetical protein